MEIKPFIINTVEVSSNILRQTPWNPYSWKGKLKQYGLTPTMRLELRELLTPRVSLKKPFRWGTQVEDSSNEPSRIRQLVDWDLELTADHVHSTLQDLSDEQWTSSLPVLLEDLQQLLRDALDLLNELGEADELSDRSHWDLPSITPHWQNRGYRDWVVLIELLRDSWLALLHSDKDSAIHVAQSWFRLPYPTYKRLALFAASQELCIAPEEWSDWLLSDDAWWLWSTDTGREVYRLFVLQGCHLSGSAQERLEAAVLAGPPRTMYRDDLEAERWTDLVARSVWLHLAKLDASGLTLGDKATTRLAELSHAYPNWRLADNERDEFSHWMSGTGDPDYEASREVDIAPRKRSELVHWLTAPPPEQTFFNEDTWREVCRTRFFHSLYALHDLGIKGIWPAARWREALQAWSEDGMTVRSWRYAAPVVAAMPDDLLQENCHSITWWLEKCSKSLKLHEGILLNLCNRILSLPLEAGTGAHVIRNGVEIYDAVGSAINHPVGHVTQALINLWFKRTPNDNELLPVDIKPCFTLLCDLNVDRFRHGRVILSSRLIALFRVDREWTERFLLPLFNWNNSGEAKALWEGFLWSPRLYQPLLFALKQSFLDCANHYEDLGEHRQQFAAFLTYAALGQIEDYTVEDFQTAFTALPIEGLEECAQALSQAVEGAADQREEYWKNRVRPFWQNIWPKSLDLATQRIAESLNRMIIATRSEFPSALSTVQDWLLPIEHPDYIVHLLHDSGLCNRYPIDSLEFLNAAIADQQWAPRELGECLDEIETALPKLSKEPQFMRLREYYRRRRT